MIYRRNNVFSAMLENGLAMSIAVDFYAYGGFLVGVSNLGGSSSSQIMITELSTGRLDISCPCDNLSMHNNPNEKAHDGFQIGLPHSEMEHY